MANLTQDELVALVLTKLRATGGSGSGSGENPNPGMSEEELEKFNDLLEKFATLQQIAFEQLNTNDLFAQLVEAGQITVNNAFANYLAVLSAVITNLNAEKISADYINVENLEAVVTQIQTANIDELFADYIKTNSIVAEGITVSELLVACGKFLSLITNSLSASDIEAFNISSDHVTFKSASIKDAAIESINAGKINAGTLNTTKVSLKDSQDKLVISDGLIQISDNTYVRVQIGRVATNQYDMRVWDEEGNMMWSASGITAAAIKDAIIVDDMIAEDANISSNKINIASLVTALNANGNVETKASNITIDAEGQKLSAWFNTIESWKSEQSEATSNIETDIETINGRLSTFVSQTDITTITNDITTIRNQYSTMNQSIDSILLRVTDNESTVANTQERLEDLEGKTILDTQDFEESVSEVKQTAQTIEFNVFQKLLTESGFSEFSQWFKFTSEGLIIGSDSNYVKLVMRNDSITFISADNGTENVLGTWTTEKFLTKNLEVDSATYLRIGAFEMVTNELGDFIIRSYK